METKDSMYKKAHDKLLGIRNNLKWDKIATMPHSAPQMVFDLTFDLAIAAEEGKLSETQYKHVLETSRVDLLCEYLTEARDIWQENKKRFNVTTNGPGTWGGNDDNMNLERNVLQFSRDQINDKYGVKEWKVGNGPVYVNDVLYGKFLRENGLTDHKGAEITKSDLPSLEGISTSNQPNVIKRYHFLQRTRL